MWLPWEMAVLLAASLAALGFVFSWSPRRFNAAAAAFATEAAIVALLYALWQFAGKITVLNMDGAFDNARWVWEIERALMLPDESSVQAMLLPHEWLVQASNIYYAGVHVPAMGIFLVWLFARHRGDYSQWRNALALVTGVCLAIQLIPVAPPRFMAEYGIVDTPLVYGQSVYGALGRGIAGQLQAMPSIHVAWAAVIAWAVWNVAPGPWRWLGVAHLAITSYVVVVTGNHYWLDGLVAMGLLVVVVGFERSARQAWISRRVAPRGSPDVARPCDPPLSESQPRRLAPPVR